MSGKTPGAGMGKASKLSDFPVSEYQERMRRARALMEKAGLDALMITSEPNHRYLTGHWTLRWYNWSRPIVSIIPATGEPIILSSSVEIGMARVTSWVKDARPYRAQDHTIEPLLTMIVQAVKDSGLGSGRIGCELGRAQRLGLPLADFHHLRHELAGVTFEDASDLLWELRRVKSQREIHAMRDSAAITNKVYADLPRWFRVGMTEEDVYRRFIARMFELGADKQGYVIVNAHVGNAYAGGPTPRKIRRGNVFYIDAGCIRKGYWSDYCRYFPVGKPSRQYADGLRALWDVTQECVQAVRPGRSIGDIYGAYERAMDRVKQRVVRAQFGRIGHGIGVDQCEPPSIRPGSDVAIQAGMTLCIEPNFHMPGVGFFIGEEQAVVTERGCELISSRAKPEGVVVG